MLSGTARATGERMVTTSDGARLRVLVDGDPQAPALTFTHSLATSSAMWDHQARAFSDRFHIVRIDFRGHGGSSTVPLPSSFERLALDVVEVWDALGIARSHYVGLSLGGIVAAALGIDHPARIGRLVMADCRFDANDPYLANWERRRQLLAQGGMTAIADDTLPTWLTSEHIATDQATVEALRSGILATPPEGWNGIVDLFPSLDYKRYLHRIAVPTLVACGAEDVVCAEMEACASLVPGARFEVIARANHLSCIDQPKAFTKVLENFLLA